MAYFDVYNLHLDTAFLGRVSSCYATETPLGEGIDPDGWAQQHAWDVAASPSFGDAYASAIAGGIGNPGSNPGVITDGMILSSVQAIMAAEVPPEPPILQE